MVEFLVGVVVGVSVAALLFIVLVPSRRVRAETGLDPEDEARVLLGEHLETDEPDEPPTSSPDDQRSYDPGELRALQELGKPGNRRSGRRRRR